MDRLLTYAEGNILDDAQLSLMKTELTADGKHDQLFAELESSLLRSMQRVRTLSTADLQMPGE